MDDIEIDHELRKILGASDWMNIPPPIFNLFTQFAEYQIKKEKKNFLWHNRVSKRSK